MTTITLSNIPDLTAAVSVPRIAAIEYPFARTVGRPGDAAGQRAVVRSVLDAAETIESPGGIVHLPFEWPESPKEAQAHPEEPAPIVGHLKRNIWQLPRLLNRNIPAG